MSAYTQLQSELKSDPRVWLVTGVAGFIGSNLAESLLRLGQRVVGLDNFSTGRKSNLEEVRQHLDHRQWKKFILVEGDLNNLDICQQSCAGVDYVLHEAALGSVPASIGNPAGSHAANVTGFLNILMAARDAKVKRFVYASSSAVYGDDPQLPKVEDKIGNALSPYAATKLMDEIYAGVAWRVYGLNSVGLRYFNVFGPRQDPAGAYAAVIPKWIASLLNRQPVFINGDGETSRDFCYVDDVVQANLLAATVAKPGAINQVYNVALGERTTLNELFDLLQTAVRRVDPEIPEQRPVHREFRPGDIRHSLASIDKARQLLEYHPACRIGEGLDLAMSWYRKEAK
ncbi:MAG TPA: SDR family oxidoreductase [Verrucomicrobiae bacterium]